jgi:hypothetical protein
LRGLSEFCGKEQEEFKEFEELQEFKEREPGARIEESAGARSGHTGGRSPVSLIKVIGAGLPCS